VKIAWPRKNLDLDTVRTLVVANDLGGYGQAAERLGRTPSAISLQMKRLQEDIGSPLFKKHGRGLALTEAGELTLRFGRRLLALNDELLDTIQGAASTDHVLPDVSSFPVTLQSQPHATRPSLDRLRAIIGEVVADSLPTVKRKPHHRHALGV
jgi:DNA-binding transcriptional LysR family regulator